MLAFRQKITIPQNGKTFRLIDAIENRTKTQTIRSPFIKVNVGSFQPFGAVGHFRPGRLHILEKYTKTFNHLTMDEIKADGFENLEDLFWVMKLFDIKFDWENHVSVIKFKYLTLRQVIAFKKSLQIASNE